MSTGSLVSGYNVDGGGEKLIGVGINIATEGLLTGLVIRNLDPDDGVGIALHEFGGGELPKELLISDFLIKAPTAIYINGDVETVRIANGVIVGDPAAASTVGVNIIVSGAGFTEFNLEDVLFQDVDFPIDISYNGGGSATFSDVVIRDNPYFNCGATPVTLTNIILDNTCYVEGLGSLPSVVAAATITLPILAEVVAVTGNTNITSITATPEDAGRRVTLVFSGTPTLTDGSNLKLGANFVASGDDAITLVCDGTNWYAAGPGSAN